MNDSDVTGGEPLAVTVSQINSKIAALLKSEETLSDVYVKGEISNFTNHHKTGHLYFTLKDENSSIKAVMFKTSASGLRFNPENGMNVTIRGDVRVFERDGQYQLYTYEMNPEGMGALYLSFLELRDKLEKEGLFAQKRPLPRSPRRVAVITAETGAAFQDILNVLGRRNPMVKLILIPALVQGANAPASITAALDKAQTLENGADVIILGRGGGAAEDLQAFNDEGVARAVFASKIPTISAVGHEIDFTICDFAADLRAPTPSAAAELCVPDLSETYAALNSLKAEMKIKTTRLVAFNSERADALRREIGAKSPSARVALYEKQFGILENQVKNAVGALMAGKRRQLIAEMKRVEALSPMNVLMRGYSIVSTKQKKTVTDADYVDIGDELHIKLHKGKIIARVEEKFEN
ncbi:MAG: exodeoxyribonuclease VII large subunit [Oscillospiraceae bacterium]|jgi:exodeoxyribonuclease VII large subunit|nr:exodeoxyribonuclease VII large subunit [Oscillospiraceae bacterium]